MAAVTCEGLFERLETRGGGLYGLSRVTQLEHALQSAALARARGLGEAMTVAALFHDVGHLRTAADVDPAARGIDDRHEVASARLLEAVFGPEVSEPVRLHVLAKRYLVTVEPAYGGRLSDDSRLSLTLQGGVLSAAEVAAFEAEPCFADAVRLRRIDDDAKVTGLAVPPLAAYRPIALALARDGFNKFQ